MHDHIHDVADSALLELDQRSRRRRVHRALQLGDDRPSGERPSGALPVADEPAGAKTAIHLRAQLRQIARGSSGDQPVIPLHVTVTIDRGRDDLPQPRPSTRAISSSIGVSDRARAVLPDIGQSLDERSWRDDRDPEGVKLKQIAVARHERVDDGRSRERDEVVVVGVAAHSRMGRRRVRNQRHHACEVGPEPASFVGREVAPKPLAPQDRGDLAGQLRTADDLDPPVEQRIERPQRGRRGGRE